MSKGGGKQTTVQTQSVDPEFKARALDVYSRAQAVSDRPYTPYTGELVAGFTPQQQQAFAQFGQAATAAQPGLAEAAQFARMAAPDFSGARGVFYNPQFGQARDIVGGAGVQPIISEAQQFAREGARYQPQAISERISAYQNPYETAVVETALKDIERSRQMAQVQGATAAARAGAFGGSRQGVAEAETNRAALDQAARTAAQLRSAGFETAGRLAAQDVGYGLQGQASRLAASGQLGQLGLQGSAAELARAGALGGFETAQAAAAAQRAQQLAGMEQAGAAARLAQANQLGQIGTAQQEAMTRGAQALFGAGGAQQQLEQARLEDAYRQFAEGRDYPLQQLQVLQQALGFFPNPMTSTGTQRQTLGPMDLISRLGGAATSAYTGFRLI